jgi:hypothetical protein
LRDTCVERLSLAKRAGVSVRKMLQFSVEKERGKRKEGAEENDAAPLEAELPPDKHFKKTGAEGQKEHSMSHSDDSYGKRLPCEIFQRHRNPEENQVGNSIEARKKTEAVNGV